MGFPATQSLSVHSGKFSSSAKPKTVVGITEANLSLLKSGKVKGVRFETLEKICDVLECQPGDLLDYEA